MMTAWDMSNHQNRALHELEVNKNDILEVAVNQQIRKVYGKGLNSLPPNAQSS